MSKALIKHLWQQNREQILRNSLLHCHARGLHSVVLLDDPAKRIRLFVATAEHDLSRNLPFPSETMSVAFHPHHCDITIEVVAGAILNRRLVLDDSGPLALQEYLYHSKLRGEKPGFEARGKVWGRERLAAPLQAGDVCEMKAAHIHTVFVHSGLEAAWLIYEGVEDPNYQPVCYSDADLTSWSAEGMHVPMTAQQVAETIALVLQ